MTLPTHARSGNDSPLQLGAVRPPVQTRLLDRNRTNRSNPGAEGARPRPAGEVPAEITEELLGDLSALQRTFVHDFPSRRSFAVISWGCAATKWLAMVLNAHPDIFCVHAANVHWSAMGISKPLDGLEYLRVVAAMGAAYPVVGDVHGISRHHVPQLRRLLKKHFNACVLVREPMARLKSQLALFHKYRQFQAWDVAYIDDVLESCQITLPAQGYEYKLFVHGASMLNAIHEERQVGKVYRSEDFTSNAEVLGDLIDDLTRGTVCPDQTWLFEMIDQRKVNCHVGHQPLEFEDWQMDVIKKVVREESWDSYMSLGYAKPPFIL